MYTTTNRRRIALPSGGVCVYGRRCSCCCRWRVSLYGSTCVRGLVGRDSPLGLFSLNPRPVSSKGGLLLRVAALLLLAASLASPLFSTGGTAHAAVLVSNMGTRMWGACTMGSSNDCTQPFTTGSNAAGYTLTSIELILGSGRDGFVNPPTVKLFSGSATGTEEATFTGPTLLTPDQSGKAYTFTPSSSVTLSASTRYWIVAEGGSNHMNWNDTQETEESGTPAAGWSIGDNGGYRRANETGPFSDRTRPRKIRVNGTIASTNAPPTASHNTVTMDEDTGYMFAVASFNYLDSDGDALSSVKIVTLPGSGKGTLKLDATAIVSEDLPKTVTKDDLDNNKLEYSPLPNGNGTGYASFTFKVNDDTVDSTLDYTMTIDINQVNDRATGKPTIEGTARVSQMLTADIRGIADVDGPPGGFAYQWQRFASNGITFEANIGMNSSTYTLQPSDEGKRIKVEVRFTDNDGNSEGPLTSDAHPSSRTINAPPTASDNTVTMDEDTGYIFAVASFNYSDSDALSSVKIVTLPGSGKGTLKLDATAIVSEDLPKTVTKDDLDNNKLEYSPLPNGNGTGYASFTFKVNDDTVDSTLDYTMTIDINQVNDRATGKPTIEGTARVSQMLTADIRGIADVDGPPGGFAYQWQRFASNGITFEANIGMNSSTYTLQPSDEGKRIKVEVRFTDNDGNSEGPLTSDAHPSGGTVAPANAPTASDNTVTMDEDTDEDTGEVEALVALYETTSGENWEDNANWKTNEPLHTWYGVTLDAEGWVTGLDLGGNGLRGEIPPAVVVNLQRLRSLYLNDNRLTAVPLAQFEALVSTPDSVLEELALWGNQGLMGMENISPELGRRVDRAALRALYDNNGGPGWGKKENWLDEADPFSFSVWYGVMTNDNGRVSELDLAGNGLTGELTDGLEELSGLERLDLYGNAGLSGVLPLGLMELPELRMVDIGDTGVCAPEDATFQRWLAGIDDFRGDICAEDADEDRLEQSGGGGCAVTSTSNTGYTPHSTAFDLLLVVSAMLLLALCKNNSRQGKT